MNDIDARENSEDESVGEHERDTGGDSSPRAQDIKQDLGNAVGEIKNRFGLLLELRDRKIKKLEQKLASKGSQRAKSRLLVVDDSASTAEILNRHLNGQPVEVVSVEGKQALEHVHSERYHAIMLEATSSIEADVDGLSLCQELCRTGKAENVIVMSSYPGDRVKDLVEEAGAAFLRKPFRREHVVQLLRDFIA